MKVVDIPIQSIQETTEIQSTQVSDCCHTTDDGSSYCAVPQDGSAVTCGCGSATSQPTLVSTPGNPSRLRMLIADCTTKVSGFWGKARGVVMFGVACVASPCCTPLIVPLILSLLAGTPVAAWLGHNLGWVYGGLTLISVISFVLAFRWMNKPKAAKPTAIRPSDIPVLNSTTGEKVHVE